jgi:hypothetical protein
VGVVAVARSSSRPEASGEDRPGGARAPLSRAFERVIARRWWILAVYALVLVPSAWFAAQVRQDNSLDRLMVATDPDYLATREFE